MPSPAFSVCERLALYENFASGNTFHSIILTDVRALVKRVRRVCQRIGDFFVETGVLLNCRDFAPSRLQILGSLSQYSRELPSSSCLATLGHTPSRREAFLSDRQVAMQLSDARSLQIYHCFFADRQVATQLSDARSLRTDDAHALVRRGSARTKGAPPLSLYIKIFKKSLDNLKSIGYNIPCVNMNTLKDVNF